MSTPPLMCGYCQTAMGKIEPKPVVLVVGNVLFHEHCFQCAGCKSKFESNDYCAIEKDLTPVTKVYCVKCSLNRQIEKKKCHGCKKGFKLMENTVQGNYHEWHESCFKCNRCEKKISHYIMSKSKKHYCSSECLKAKKEADELTPVSVTIKSGGSGR